ncbi:hypothetical protein ACLOJK_020117 [Asimina triloba]
MSNVDAFEIVKLDSSGRHHREHPPHRRPMSSFPSPISINGRSRRKHHRDPIFMTNPNEADPGTSRSSGNPNIFLTDDHSTVDLDPGRLDGERPIIKANIQRPATPHLKQHPTGVRSWVTHPNHANKGVTLIQPSNPSPTLHRPQQ